MNENKNLQPLNENDLSDVSGGLNQTLPVAKHSIGQTVHFSYIDQSFYEPPTHYLWFGRIVDIHIDTVDVHYIVEVVGEEAEKVLRDNILSISMDDVID